jgi:hypothetical protein
MLASGVELNDVLCVLRARVDRRSFPLNQTLNSWADQWFLKAVAELESKHVLVPALVAKWLKTSPGTAAERVSVSEVA